MRAQEILRERSTCQNHIDQQKNLERLLGDAEASLELADESKDEEFISEAIANLDALAAELKRQEFLFKMRGEFDSQSAIIEINAGAGGTEAQDWAEMLLRMYLRWGERKGFRLEALDYLAGDGAGIKHATIAVQGEYAYGFLRGEAGVHRLVRISPFDSNARRHTSFASVKVTPDIEQEIEIVIDDKDLRVDTYRSSGAGGQHVNKTDSAVRLTHMPSGIVVACQNERSQHKNKDRAMKILKSKLYELEREQQAERIDQIRGASKKIDFGSQIRSYVLEPYQLVKDVRTDHQTSSVDAVLDGDLDPFMESYLMSDQ
jgi:peptide chain release factor 2